MKKTKRKGFNFFRSYYDVFNELSDKDKLSFIEALLDKQFLGINPEGLEGMAKFAWISQVNSIDSQVKGFEDKTGIKLTPNEGGVVRGENNPTEQVEEKVEEKVKVYDKSVHDCFNNCLNYFPSQLHPKNEKIKNNWLDTLEKLNRIDGVPFDVIEDIVKNVRNDDFWASNFMAIPKLRKKDKNGLMYIIVFNEKFKNNGTKKTRREKFMQKLQENLNGGGSEGDVVDLGEYLP